MVAGRKEGRKEGWDGDISGSYDATPINRHKQELYLPPPPPQPLSLLSRDFTHIERLQRPDDILRDDGREPREVHHREVSPGEGPKHVQQRARPVARVAHRAQVTQRLLGGANLLLLLAQFVREGDQEAAVAFALTAREGQYAGEVIA